MQVVNQSKINKARLRFVVVYIASLALVAFVTYWITRIPQVENRSKEQSYATALQRNQVWSDLVAASGALKNMFNSYLNADLADPNAGTELQAQIDLLKAKSDQIKSAAPGDTAVYNVMNNLIALQTSLAELKLKIQQQIDQSKAASNDEAQGAQTQLAQTSGENAELKNNLKQAEKKARQIIREAENILSEAEKISRDRTERNNIKNYGNNIIRLAGEI